MRLDHTKVVAEFLYYQLRSGGLRDEIRGRAKGANPTMIKISKADVQTLPIYLPPIQEQSRIALKLAQLENSTDRLADVCSRKITALNVLKQSLLCKAFSGQLVAKVNEATTAPLRNQQAAVDLTAAVLSFAYQRHAAQRRERTFGRVKAQKTLHLVEAIAGVELGRNPIKDAAGPNDFGHMLKAEEWAKSRSLFEFANRSNGYDFKPLTKYKTEIGALVASLGSNRQSIQRVIDLLIPLSSQQAEVLATVHAAWNNLLADGKTADDSAILYEARQNWHASKLKIAESKFKDAIKFIRAKGIVPDGTAKRVRGQDRLV